MRTAEGHLIKREEKWQKWSNLGGQIAKNVLTNGRNCGSSDCIFILVFVICDCYMDHGISAIGAKTSPVL